MGCVPRPLRPGSPCSLDRNEPTVRHQRERPGECLPVNVKTHERLSRRRRLVDGDGPVPRLAGTSYTRARTNPVWQRTFKSTSTSGRRRRRSPRAPGGPLRTAERRGRTEDDGRLRGADVAEVRRADRPARCQSLADPNSTGPEHRHGREPKPRSSPRDSRNLPPGRRHRPASGAPSSVACVLVASLVVRTL
jgi:hypothetical protein